MYQYPTPKHRTNTESPPPQFSQFVRGTTPTFRYTIKDSAGDPVDLSQYATIKVTMAQQVERVTDRRNALTLTDVTVDGNVINFQLTEAQSLIFSAGWIALQIYGQDADSHSWATLAEDVSIRVRKSLKDGDTVDGTNPPSQSFQLGDQTVTGTLTVDHITYTGGGTSDYSKLTNKPALVYGETRKELVGDVRMSDFGLREESVQPVSNTDINDMIRRLF